MLQRRRAEVVPQRPAEDRHDDRTLRPSTVKRTDLTRRVELAATSSRWLFSRHDPAAGSSQSTAVPATTCSSVVAVRVFGMIDVPTVSMFFASWKSEETMRSRASPGFSGGALAGSGKTATPVTGSYDVAPTRTPR